MAARISICTLNPLKVPWNQIHIWCQFGVLARKIRQPTPFCNIDVTQTMAYWCSQKVVAYYEIIIRNLERVLKLFKNTISSFCGWFICFFPGCSLEYNKGRSWLSEFISFNVYDKWVLKFAKHVHITTFALNMKQI